MKHGPATRPRRWLIAFGAACALLVSARARGAAGSSEAFASPSRGEILAPGSILEVRWTAACDGATEREDGRDRVEREREPMREVDEAELVLSLDGGLTFPIRVSTELSPCAGGFDWRVPSLASPHARLALRTGEGARGESERLALLSEDFTILPDPEGLPERLYARRGEWWTPEEAPVRRPAQDSLERTLGDAAARLTTPVRWTEAAAPASPNPAAERLPGRPRRVEPDLSTRAATNARALTSSPAAPVPMRC